MTRKCANQRSPDKEAHIHVSLFLNTQADENMECHTVLIRNLPSPTLVRLLVLLSESGLQICTVRSGSQCRASSKGAHNDRLPHRAASPTFSARPDDVGGQAPPGSTHPDAETEFASPRDVAARPKGNSALVKLTPRERYILTLVYRGLTNAEIAQHLGVGVRTVKGYLSTLLAKFDATNRTELIGCAVDLGLIGYTDRVGKPSAP